MRYITAVLVLLSLPAAACEFAVSELSLGGIEAGVPEASVIGLLGAPGERIDTGEGTELRYPGLVVSVGWLEQAAPGVERRVLGLRAKGAEVCTPGGLCPGMPVAHATKLYGAAEPVVRGNVALLEYQPEAAHCWLQVAAEGGTITSLAVACQP